MDVITKTCMYCGHSGVVKNVSETGYANWKAGAFIQNALPELSADEREQLMTGTHGPCFDEMFPEEEDEEYPYEDPGF